MRRAVAALVMLVLSFAAVPALALEPWVLYDNFNAATIDPGKWFGVEGNPFGPLSGITPGHGTDARRFLQTGRLKLVYRAFGSTATNSGSTFSSWRLHFLNPAAVTAIRATVVVHKHDMTSCPLNPETTRVRMRIQGSFFNAATPIPGDFTNDVFGLVRLQRRSDSVDPPGVFQVQGLVFRCNDPACDTSTDLPTAALGSLATGQTGTLQVQWDPDNNQFLFAFGTVAAAVPYPWPDGAAPGVPGKRLDLQMSVPNCTAAPRPTGALDVSVDNVFVNASGVPLAASAPAAPASRTNEKQ